MPHVTVSARPHFTPAGTRSGWAITAGSKSSTCKNAGACQRDFNKTIKNFLGAGYSVTATIFDAKGAMTSKSNYKMVDGSPVRTQEDVPKSKKPSGKKPAGKKPTGKKPAGKKPSGGKKTHGAAMASGLKRYHAFLKAAQAAGLTAKQAKAAWKKIADKPKTTTAAAKLGSAAKKGKAPAKSAKKVKKTRKTKPAATATASKKTKKTKKSKKKATAGTSTGLPKLGAPKSPKKSSKKTSAPKSSKPKRKPSAYNNFLGAYLRKHAAGLAVTDPKRQAAFKAGVAKWNKLSDANKAKAKTSAGAAKMV